MIGLFFGPLELVAAKERMLLLGRSLLKKRRLLLGRSLLLACAALACAMLLKLSLSCVQAGAGRCRQAQGAELLEYICLGRRQVQLLRSSWLHFMQLHWVDTVSRSPFFV